MQNILSKSTDNDQLKWDRLKGYVKKLTKNYCSNRSSWRQDKLKQLQSERNTLMRHFKNDQAAMQTQLPKIDQNIGYLQHEMARDAALKADKRWLVHNENSVGFLKKTAERQLAQRTIDIITHPSSNVPCLSTSDKLDAVQSFYSELYSPEPIHRYSIDNLLRGIQKTISTEDADHIISEITIDDILTSANRCSKVSSPGRDGLPYPVLRLILAHADCKDLLTNIYRDALNLGVFPSSSWQQTCIVLLPNKKGDLCDLANWRPISLINTDCKVFTRILYSGVITAANKVITRQQAGFMPSRFIGNHGLALRILMKDA